MLCSHLNINRLQEESMSISPTVRPAEIVDKDVKDVGLLGSQTVPAHRAEDQQEGRWHKHGHIASGGEFFLLIEGHLPYK